MDCSFLHHMEYKPHTFYYGMTNEEHIEGWRGRCRNKGCTFTHKVLGPLPSHRTAPGPSDRDKGSPHTTAGVRPSTRTPAPFKGA